MFGYVVATSKNSIVFLDGDAEFKNHLRDMIRTQIHDNIDEVASTSSGVFTDSGEQSKSHPKKSRKRVPTQFSSSEVAHVLLPLISMYRASAEATRNAIFSMNSPHGSIQFKRLSNDFIIFSFGTIQTKMQELITTVELSLHTNFGPLLDLCDTELSAVKASRENINSLMDRMNRNQPKAFLNIRRSIYYQSQIVKVQNLLQSICSQLSLFIGNNRCLLTSNGDLLASISSKPDSQYLLNSISAKDIQCVLNQLHPPAQLMTGSVSQFWLRSSTGVIPYYINAIQCKLTDNLMLLCLNETPFDQLIRHLCLFLKQLEKIRETTNFWKDIKEVGRTVTDVQTLLINTKLPATDSSVSLAFMKNTLRTAKYIQSVWEQIENEIRRAHGFANSSMSHSRLSFGSLRSAFSTISINSSVFSRSTATCQNFSPKFDVLLAYAKRQVVSIIQEICALSIFEANNTLALFQQSITKIIRENHRIHLQALGIGDEAFESKIESFLQPSDMHLDMLGYKLNIQNQHLTFSFIPENLKEDLLLLPKLQTSGDFCIDVVGQSGRKYTIYHTKTSCIEKMNENFVNRLWHSREEKRTAEITLTVVFENFVHKSLALRQIKTLQEILSQNIVQVNRFYN